MKMTIHDFRLEELLRSTYSKQNVNPAELFKQNTISKISDVRNTLYMPAVIYARRG